MMRAQHLKSCLLAALKRLTSFANVPHELKTEIAVGRGNEAVRFEFVRLRESLLTVVLDLKFALKTHHRQG